MRNYQKMSSALFLFDISVLFNYFYAAVFIFRYLWQY